MRNRKNLIGVIGLGYVGLPLALTFAKKYETIGFDVSRSRVKNLNRGIDETCEVSKMISKSLNYYLQPIVQS